MHQSAPEVGARLERVVRERLAPRLHVPVATLDVEIHPVGDGQSEPVPASEVLADPDGLDWRPIDIGAPWGPAWGTAWFRLTGLIDLGTDISSQDELEVVLDLGWKDHSAGFQAEGLVYRRDGSVIKAVNPRNAWVPLLRPDGSGEWDGAGRLELYLEAAANPLLLDVPPFALTWDGEKETAGSRPRYRLERAQICRFDRELFDLVTDLTVLGELAEHTHDDDPRRWTLVAALTRSLDVLDVQDLPGTLALARAELAPELAKPASASAHHLTAVGHAHIDSAWLWPLRETRRKVARTVANALALLDREEDFVYVMSSAQHFYWLEQDHPELFARLSEQVAAGRFVPVGGMWVEADTTMPGSEAMLRQFVHGRRYFVHRFGRAPREVWLPDSFGYSAALPQLARLAGFRWFLTQKISWNESNDFPHHTFWWEGIDGTRIFTHFPPVDTYSAELTGAELHHAVANFRDKGLSSHSLVPFGYGDGGGGPTREMLARAHRWSDLEGAPRVTMRPPAEFFAEAQAEYQTAAATWSGELYLERHRGTFTSQHAIKRANRRSEALVLEAERAAAAATLLAGAPYPYPVLDDAWRTLLLHQFHDILPGSSIGWVYREAEAEHARIAGALDQVVEDARRVLARVGPGSQAVPPVDGAPPTHHLDDDGRHVLRSGAVRVVVDDDGHLVSVRDLRVDPARELVAPGERANVLQLLRDEPTNWDAWDIDRHASRTVRELARAESVEPWSDGEATGVRIVRSFGRSRATQRIWLSGDDPEVHCDIDIDWRERERLLKVSFPLDLHASQAQYETQYGYVTRATHENTSWDAARFEVCTHRYTRISDGGYGVAIVNDSSYGCDVTRHPRDGEAGSGGTVTVARLSLLRSPRYPDPEADQGRHYLRWALLPAASTMVALRAAEQLGRVSAPVAEAEDLARLRDGSTAALAAVKLADDGSGDLILRIYEAGGAATTAHLSLAVSGVARVVGPAEHDDDDIPHPEVIPSADGFSVRLGPFQVLTIRIADPRRKVSR